MSLPERGILGNRRSGGDRRGRAGSSQPSGAEPTAAGASGLTLRGTLAEGASRLGVPLAPPQLDRLMQFRALLEKWNRVHNLTAVRGGPAVVVRHFLDSLAIVPALHSRSAMTPGRPLRVLDAGSGPGLPGIVVAIALPDAEVCCVEAVAKKAAFMRHAAAELGLQNLRAEHARVETVQAGSFDVVVSRAFSSLDNFVRLTRHHIAPAGAWLAMKGQHPGQEVAALPPDVEVFHVEPVCVPGAAAARCLVWMRTR